MSLRIEKPPDLLNNYVNRKPVKACMLARVLKFTVKKTAWLRRAVQTPDAINRRVYPCKLLGGPAPWSAKLCRCDSEKTDNRRVGAGRKVQRPGVTTNENACAVLNKPGNEGQRTPYERRVATRHNFINVVSNASDGKPLTFKRCDKLGPKSNR